ncbi:molybdenum cofactor guanylyltransferase [Archaeoglobales archaeon]|nr:MAG: molybdenum cofactor guanylyltransferase [Archaeoglobales archaeon]
MLKAAVLVGGKGERIGEEKAMLKVCGKRFLEKIVETLKDFEIVVVCRNSEQIKTYKDVFNFDCPFIKDTTENFGPLAGIHAALNYFKDYTLIVAVDLPLLKREVAITIYRECIRMQADALIPAKGNKFEPLLACYSYNVIKEIEKSFEKSERKILIPINRLKKVVFYDIENLRKIDKNLVSFFNVNTKQDLKRVEELCSSIDTGGE